MSSSTRVETKTYLDDMQQYMPILESLLSMTITRPEPRQLRVSDGVTSCTVQFPAYIDRPEEIKPSLQQAAETVKMQTQKLQENYVC